MVVHVPLATTLNASPATAEHREPCDSRGSCTVLGAPGGEIPPGDSTSFSVPARTYLRGMLHCTLTWPPTRHKGERVPGTVIGAVIAPLCHRRPVARQQLLQQ